MATKVIMPQLGESVVEGTVTRWLKQPGDTVQEFEPILEVNTDKVDTEIPAPAAGVLLAVYVAEGTTVERGALLAIIGQPGESVPDEPTQAAHSEPAGQDAVHQERAAHATNGVTAGNTGTATAAESGAARYSPVVMRMAAEHNIDLSQLRGSGMGGRVTKKDVEAYLSGTAAEPATAELAPWEQPGGGDLFKPTDEIFAKASGKALPTTAPSAAPAPTPTKPATPASKPVSAPAPDDLPGELVAHSTMRRVIAEHMVRSKLQTAPHVTTVFEVDMSRVMAHWKANEAPFATRGLRLTLTAYFVLAIVRATQAQPTLNARWTDGGLFVPSVINVGMAVALKEGLIVPVIHSAQDLNLSGMARQVSDLASRARSNALKPDDTRGGTITLTNHGVSGSLLATPIINQPQSAIVGVGAVTKRVVVLTDGEGNDTLAIRPMMYATLTFDHRVADGAVGDAFMATFKRTLEGWSGEG